MSMWDDTGYDLNDPKHPTFADRYADAADRDRKYRREHPELFPVLPYEGDPGDETQVP